MGLIITGSTMIFRKDFENGAAYSINVGSKKQGGTYDNAYLQVRFHKGVDVPNKTKINIKESFFSSYNGKPYLFVKEYESDAPAGFEYATVEDIECPF